MALQREKPFPFTIMDGTLDASEELHLAAEMEVLCTFKGNLIEAILVLSYSLLLCYHVQLSPFHKFVFFFFFFFLYLQKGMLKINGDKKLPSSGITIVNQIDSLELRN